ncbi:MAG: CPBP family intramembrane metalloprotease [Propionibacteriaceae bacterium]|nr:CPBP family intramembrane metalloprotease [Propionibacteriaceae bacterium]
MSAPINDEVPETLTGSSAGLRTFVILEILIVLGISFGRSAISSIISIIERLTRGQPLSEQTTGMNQSVTPDRPWLDIAYQLYYFILPTAQVLLVLYLLYLAYGHARSLIGFDLKNPLADLAKGFGICAAVGIPGIGFYLLAREIGINTTVSPANLTDAWWAIPVLICSAIVAGISEEVIMLGYLFTRMKTVGVSTVWIVIISSVIRGSYHLYQGFGGFIGNLVMGIAFGLLYLRWKRVMPLVITHTLLDIFAFVGYSLLAPYISWL